MPTRENQHIAVDGAHSTHNAIGPRANLAAIELVEYSPRLDPSGRSARVAVDIVRALLSGAREQAQVVS